MTIPQALELAVQRHQAGRLGEAEALYRQILAVDPKHADALHLLGVIAHQAGRHDLAVGWIRQSVGINPNNAAAFYNLGDACRALGRVNEAIFAYRQALQVTPNFPESQINLGNTLAATGRLDEAIAAFRCALELRPDYLEAHNNLGTALAEQGRFDEAIVSLKRTLELKPDYAEARNNLGNLFRGQGRLNEAIAEFQRALQIKPDLPDSHNNLGNALREQGHLHEAIAECRRAIELRPDYAEAHNNLGNALSDQGQRDEAIAAYRRALEYKQDYADAANNLGIALAEERRFDEAVTAYQKALQLRPSYADACNNLGSALRERGQLDEAIAAYRRAIQIKPDQPEAHSNLIYTLHFHPDDDRKMIVEEWRRWNQQFSHPLKPHIQPYANDRGEDRPLRIGYVSPDFRDHVVGRNLLPLFQHHDHRGFEILCYSGVVRPDKLTEEFRQRADQWRSTVGVRDEDLAEMIRRDRVDILVDLTQHLSRNRLPMFARKPAPVQVSFAGYPESTGLEAIEYRISDRYLEAGSPDEHTARKEKVRLIGSFWCYDPCGVEVKVSEAPVGRNGIVTFGCLNNFCKINDRTLILWARVLDRVKNSRLVMASPIGSHREQTLRILRNEGVDERRVEFQQFRSRRAYLELYHELDIVLDSAPYNGHTTNLDALWMGVPVVSLVGKVPVSRAGLSQLTNIGLPELAVHSEEDYVRIAAELADDIPRLAQLRATLRPRMEASPLMDAPQFARGIEAAFRSIWQEWLHRQSTGTEGL